MHSSHSTMIRTIRHPESKQATTLTVAVRCRPLTDIERSKSRGILRVVDDKVVVVLDPDAPRDYLDRAHNRSKEKSYAFDFAFGAKSTNKDVYNTAISSYIDGVAQGLNATVFAYGATGSGKTHTMAGTTKDPGLMVLSLQEIFRLVAREEREYEFEVTCSYLEVYNEIIYDLLERSSGHLELREDPDQGITVAGLKRIQVNSAEKILELLHLGNSRRKTESTDANATSSRSHAVLEIIVKRKQRNQYRPQVLRGKLALVDLAGSERASETNNAGQKLRDGANINRSLLALANCINALGKQQKKGLAYVPYRNSKLTRILKDGLSGNSRTIMLATVSSGDDQYHYTINTLKYADRAKEIKTHIQKNIGTLDSHVADYQQMIGNLQVEVCQLKKELAEKQIQLSGRSTDKTQDNEMSWLDLLSRDINENVEERINLQKALFELEDINLQNRIELQQLDELIARHKAIEEDGKVVEALVERRQVILDNVRDNDEAGGQYQEEIEQNEAQRKELQHTIDEAMRSNGNMTYLRILSQYRLLGMTNTELQFQIAIRDHIISNQREILSNLWTLLEGSGLDHKQILELAARQGITIENWIVPPAVTCRTPTVGSPLSCKENQGTTCGQCISLGHLPPSPDRPRTYEHLNWKICSSCRNTDCQNASPKCLHSQLEEFCSGGRERSNQKGYSQFPMMQLISPNHKLDKGYLLTSEFCENQALLPPRMCVVPTSQGLITRKLSCEMCLLGPKDNCVCPLVPKAASPPAIAGIRADSHGKLRRQTWPEKQHCCSNNERNICTTCSFDANERRGAECCCIGCARRRSCSSCEGFQHLEEYEHQKDFPPTNINCQKLQGSHQESFGDYECDSKQSKVESMWERIGNGNKIYFSHNGGHHTSSSLAKSYIMYNSHNTEDEIHRFSDVPYRASKLSSIISVRSGCATHRCAGSAETLMEGQKTMAFESEWDLVSSPLQPRRLWPGERADCM